jgi:transposase
MNKELRTNARELSQVEQFQFRKSIIRLSDEDRKVKDIARIFDVSERHVISVRGQYKKNGLAGISLKCRGRRIGEKRSLTPEQEKEIREIIVDKTPEQFMLKCCMWTRKNIRELIKRKYGISIPLSTLGRYLDHWGFSVQKPSKRAYKQDPEKVEQWLNEIFPAINMQAKAQNADIYWGDETGVQNTADYLRGYAPKGKTPVVRVESQKFKANLLSAVSNRGKVRFVIYDRLSSDKLIDFMRRLVKDTSRKVILLLRSLNIAFSMAQYCAGRRR